MVTPVEIGIIGSGKVGQALGSWFAAADASVGFSSRDPIHAEEAALKAGQGAKAMSVADLVHNCDVVFLTLPYDDVSKVLRSVGGALNSKIIVDVTNPVTQDRQELKIGHTTSGAEEIARQFPSALVVKAFNSTFAEIYEARLTKIAGRAITIFYAGDDAAAKEKVKQLILRLGFDAVDTGPLSSARCLEPMSLLNIRLGRFLGFGTAIGFSLVRR
jgi:predicted dinucleotide-binding enzyme